MAPTRPPLSSELTGAELRRWYWLKTELISLARELGVRTTGGKQQLTTRLAAALDGAPPPDERASRPGTAGALPEPLTLDTVLPPGQRCTQQLRRFLEDRIGPRFRFDAHMRAFVAEGSGRSLAQAVEHWHATRSAPTRPIEPQFEFNRFRRAWHAAHPDGDRESALAAWKAHRAAPVDARSPGPG